MSFTFLQRLLRESRGLALACALIPAVPLADRPGRHRPHRGHRP